MLLVKSEDNLRASQLLISNKHYCSSVHCSYYSCLQKVLHVLFEEYQLKFEEVNRGRNIEGKGSHQAEISYFTGLLETETKDKAKIRLFSKITHLKKLREDADYKKVNITEESSKNALQTSIEIGSLINEVFKL